MPGPLLIRDGDCQSLQLAGITPGLFPEVCYDEFSLYLAQGDSLLFCSDGLTEARNTKDEEFGLEGLKNGVHGECRGVSVGPPRTGVFCHSEVQPGDAAVG